LLIFQIKSCSKFWLPCFSSTSGQYLSWIIGSTKKKKKKKFKHAEIFQKKKEISQKINFLKENEAPFRIIYVSRWKFSELNNYLAETCHHLHCYWSSRWIKWVINTFKELKTLLVFPLRESLQILTFTCFYFFFF
jgi:hypothetical protein